MEINNWCKPSIISIAVASALFSPILIAQEQEADVETLTVTGQQQSALDISISQDALAKMQANDLSDVFDNEPEVAVGGTGVAEKIYVRGLEDTMLNVSIDGATQSGYLFHHQGRISVEPELLKEANVQAGAGNALSGPGALGGAIQFVTKDPQDMLRGDETFGALVKGGYYSNSNGYKASVSLYGQVNDNWSALATVIQTAADDYKDGEGNDDTNSEYDQQSGFVKLVGEFDDNQRFSVSHDRRVDDGDRLQRGNWAPSIINEVIPQEALRQTTTVKYAINPSSNQLVDLETSAYYTDNNFMQEGSFGDYQGGVESFGLDIRNTSIIENKVFTYGIDYRNDVASLNNNSDPTYDTNEDKGDVLGLYIQSNIQLAQEWQLNLGTRYDIYKLTDTADQEFEHKGFSPNASVVFTPSEALNLTLGYSQVMRGIQTKETYVLDYYQNAEDRKEETARNIEFAVDYHLNDVALSATVYRATIDDVVSTMDLAGGSSTELGNVGELTTDGFSLAARYNWQAFNTSLSYNHNKAELNGSPLSDSTYTLGTSTGDNIVAKVSYQASDSVEFGWTGNFVTRLTDVAEGEYEKAGYGVNDIYGQWLPLADDSLTVTFTVKNVFDKQYRDQATYGYYPGYEYIYGPSEPGRDFRLNVAWAL
ncbi:TonB-dependent receptor domain-containing protein [Vibrio sp. WJH972]